MDTHWKKRFKAMGPVVDRVARGFFVAALLVLTFGPLPLSQQATPAEAGDLEWKDVRPPLTDEADTDETNGFRHLPSFGDALHSIVVAPNGDIFAAGTGAEVDTNADGDCDDATDADADTAAADGDCDAVGAVNPVVFKSTDGGMKWRAARLPADGGTAATAGAGVGATIQRIVVSPDYPTDDFVIVVFNAGAAAATTNGVCWSTDAGLTFSAGNCWNGAAASSAVDGDWDDVIWGALALSADFNFNDGNGEVALGGTFSAGPTTAVIAANKLDAGTPLVDIVDGTASAAAIDMTLHVAYTYDEEPSALARLYVHGTTGKTYAQVRGSGGWAVLAAGEELLDDDLTSFIATSGMVSFDDDYTTGGVLFAAAGAGGTVGGVFRFSGTTWAEKTFQASEPCDTSIDSLTVAGNGSSSKLVASASASTMVCRSTNEGSSWSDQEADGGDSVCDNCGMVGGMTRVSNNRVDPAVVYWTNSGLRGGIAKSTNTGSSWLDTGLTNYPYVVTSISETTADNAFAAASSPPTSAGIDALFWTTNYGTGAVWQRVLRYDDDDLSLIDPSSDFATTGVVYARRSTATTDNILKSTDGGKIWDNTSGDPFESSPDTNELAVASSARSASVVYIGSDKGHVSSTTDGGATWTLLSKDFGDGIDEFDFKSETVFFVTAQDTDNVRKVWLTTDGGATFTEIGSASGAWGSGNPSTGAFSTTVTAYDATKGGVILVTVEGASTDDVWRYDTTAASPKWVDGGTDTKWDSVLFTSAAGIGDGYLMTLWNNDGAGELRRTYFPLTTTSSNWTDVRLPTQLPPVFTSSSSLGTSRVAGGYTLQVTASGRVQDYTLTTAFQAGIALNSPVNNGTVPTNVGDEGVPAVFRWTSVGKAACYDLQIALEETFDAPALDPSGIAGACPAATDGIVTGATYQVDRDVFALVVGQTYWWRARVRSTDASLLAGVTNPGPWSQAYKLTVSTTSPTVNIPTPSLPLDGSQLPGLSTQLSWNNPPGVTQVQVQVTPLNGDGPAINLILGSAVTTYEVPAPVFGTGPYVILPGASYTWRVRTTTSTTAVAETDPSWGPWSTPRTFTTALPNSGTIQLLGPINGESITDTTPTLQWKDANSAMFYYEVQLSADPNFGASGVVAAVYWNLLHAGQSTPPSSWTVPDAFKVTPGTYYWRVRQRLQATPKGSAETGIAWSPTQMFSVK